METTGERKIQKGELVLDLCEGGVLWETEGLKKEVRERERRSVQA